LDIACLEKFLSVSRQLMLPHMPIPVALHLVADSFEEQHAAISFQGERISSTVLTLFIIGPKRGRDRPFKDENQPLLGALLLA
jgi:hypothetical protein